MSLHRDSLFEKLSRRGRVPGRSLSGNVADNEGSGRKTEPTGANNACSGAREALTEKILGGPLGPNCGVPLILLRSHFPLQVNIVAARHHQHLTLVWLPSSAARNPSIPPIGQPPLLEFLPPLECRSSVSNLPPTLSSVRRCASYSSCQSATCAQGLDAIRNHGTRGKPCHRPT